MEDSRHDFARHGLSWKEPGADQVVVLDAAVMIVHRDAVADGIEDRLQLVGLVSQLHIGSFAFGDILGRAVKSDHFAGVVDRRLDDGIDPLEGAVRELQAVFDFIALAMLDAQPEVLYHVFPVLGMDHPSKRLLGSLLPPQAQDAQQFVRSLHLGGDGIEAPGAHMGHGLGLGQVVLAFRKGLLGDFFLRDVHQHREALLPRCGGHGLYADIQRLLPLLRSRSRQVSFPWPASTARMKFTKTKRSS